MCDIKPVIIQPAAVTATTVFPVVNVENAEKATFIFTRADHGSGSSAFTVDGSLDGTTFVGINTLIDNVTNTNGQNPTRIATSTLNSNTSKIYSLDLESFNYKEIRVTVTETTDGTHSYKALIEF